MPLDIRHVAYWPRKGVFLGLKIGEKGKGMRWSKDDEGDDDDLAPTFESAEEFKKGLSLNKLPELTPEEEAEIQFREVVPTGPNNQATMKDCTDILLPAWGSKALKL